MQSFRSRLALRAALAVAVGMLALSAVTVLTLGNLLDREIDAAILNIAAIQAASLGDGPDGEMHFHEWELTPDEAASVRDLVQYAQVWEADGSSLLRSQYMTADLPVDRTALTRAADGELVWTRQDFQSTSVRTLFYPLERLGAAHRAHVLQVAAPLSQRNAMLRRAALFFAALTAVMSVAAYAGSSWLAGSAVRPVHAVIDQAEEIGVASLDRRIDAYAETLEYRRLVDVLNVMLDRIHHAFEAQRRFTADASHELRSPLTVMRGEIDVALRRPRSAEEYRAVLRSTAEEVARLSRIAEGLLTLARSDSNTLLPRVQRTDIDTVIKGVVDRLSARASSRSVRVDVEREGPTDAWIDGGILGQVTWNLVDNAIGHSPPGGRVGLTAHVTSRAVRIVVEDEGPGLDDMDSESVFERFSRGDVARTHAGGGGTGLGLAIVRALAEAHGGSAHAEEAAGGGARFVVVLGAPDAEDGNSARV